MLPKFIKGDPQNFWRYLGPNKEVLTKIKVDGNFVTEGKEIAKIFNQYFQSVFTPKDDNEARAPPVNSLEVPVISVNGVLSMLRKLKVKKSSGPDGLPNAFLKRYALQLAAFLAKIFQVFLLTGEVPDVWNRARVLPIHKKGDNLLVSNYRPI